MTVVIIVTQINHSSSSSSSSSSSKSDSSSSNVDSKDTAEKILSKGPRFGETETQIF